MNTNLITSVVSYVCILFMFAAEAAAQSNPVPNVPSTLRWRQGGANYNAELLLGDYYTTARTGWCSAGHVTNNNNRYNHVHVTSTFNYQYGGTTITPAMVNAYWDWRYTGYSGVGELSQTSNCYGYATGHNTWIDGIDVILADEYIATNAPQASIVRLGSHMKRITAYFPCPVDVTDACETYEKNRDSRVYRLLYLYAKWPDPDPTTFLNSSYRHE